jgi:hypothetical protein
MHRHSLASRCIHRIPAVVTADSDNENADANGGHAQRSSHRGNGLHFNHGGGVSSPGEGIATLQPPGDNNAISIIINPIYEFIGRRGPVSSSCPAR